jgi:hypothetical protein
MTNRLSGSDGDGSPSVNELLTNLRISQTLSEDARAVPVVAPSMPAAIRELLNIPDTPGPQPRRRQRVGADGRRLPAGPAPPRSWLESSVYAPSKIKIKDGDTARSRSGLNHLPGVMFPTKTSLKATCLRHMGLSWDFQKEYNQYYLATLPTELRMVLLSFIAYYGPEEGISNNDLKTVLCLSDDDADGFSGNDDFHRLDLSGAIGRSISLKQLRDIISAPIPGDAEADSWDSMPVSLSATLSAPLTSLKYVSLADPPSSISWRGLLALARSMPTVTHLSLASWPTPNLTLNSNTATVSSRYSPRIQYGATNHYSHTLDNDWSEAAAILRRLSTSLYSLEYLDISGCSSWFPALRWTATPGIDWASHWGKVRVIDMHGHMVLSPPGCSNRDIVEYKHTILRALELEKHIRKRRGWIEVQHDDWNMYDWLWKDGEGVGKVMDSLFDKAKVGWDDDDAYRDSTASAAGAGASAYWD